MFCKAELKDERIVRKKRFPGIKAFVVHHGCHWWPLVSLVVRVRSEKEPNGKIWKICSLAKRVGKKCV